jgi:hypothetical protein
MTNYFVIKSKLNNLVLQVDDTNRIATDFGIQSQHIWVVTAQETQADNQLWMLNPQGQIQSKFNGLVLDIGTENLLTLSHKYHQYLNYLSSQGLVYPPLLVTSPQDDKLTQQWTIEWELNAFVIKSNQDGKVLDIFGALPSEFVPITLAPFSPSALNQQWEIMTPASPSASGTRDTLNSGEILKPGECLTSANGVYSFCYLTNSNLVHYENKDKPNMRVLWQANSHLYPPAYQCHLQQSDGKLVVFNVPGHATWSSQKFGSQYPPSQLIVQDNGHVIIYDKNGAPYWDSLEETNGS